MNAADITARDVRVMFAALVGAGFSEHQAIELCAPWVCIDGRSGDVGQQKERADG